MADILHTDIMVRQGITTRPDTMQLRAIMDIMATGIMDIIDTMGIIAHITMATTTDIPTIATIETVTAIED
jgi:hypothetical protein